MEQKYLKDVQFFISWAQSLNHLGEMENFRITRTT